MDPNAVILIALALTLFIAEVKVSTHGVLTGLGMIALVIGAALLIRSGAVGFGVGPWVVGLLVLGLVGLFVVWTSKVAASRRLPAYPGLVPEAARKGIARTALEPEGEVFVDGALWSARARVDAIPAGAPITVVGRQGLLLEVEPRAAAAPGAQESEKPR